MKILLNLGAGHDIRQSPGSGWLAINHDRARFSQGVDEVWNLNQRPWPWVDNSIHILIANSVLEHLSLTLVESINECWRILKPDGLLDLKLPLFDRAKSYQDPTHRWFVADGVLDTFDPTTERGRTYRALYGISPWRIEYQHAEEQATCLRGKLRKVKL